MGDKFNVFLDNLKSVLNRFIELPVYAIVLGLMGALLMAFIVFKFFTRNQRRKSSSTPFMLLAAAGLFMVFGITIDKKLNRVSTTIESLDYKMFSIQDNIGDIEYILRLNGLDKNNIDSTVRQKLYPSLDSFRKDYRRNFLVSERSLNPATDLIIIRAFDPLSSAFIAVVDLTQPGLEVKLTPQIKEKYLTSDFAKQNNCFLAINGEAGMTPEPNCKLGKWTGNFIVNGVPLLQEDTKERPFLSFDANLKAKYFRENIVDTNNTADKYNTIWGRFDLLVDGKEVVFADDYQYPRTIMGIDKEGTKLYLMVVDGSQPAYSMGLTYGYCASFIKYLGAYQAMACDQGGSSCMYLEQFGGIVNRPRDGRERVVYTHFGLHLND